MRYPNCLITGCVLRNRDTGEQWNGDLFQFGHVYFVNANPRSLEVIKDENPEAKIVWFWKCPFNRNGVFLFDLPEIGSTWGLNTKAKEYIGSA